LIHFWEYYINTVLYLNIQISPAALETTLLSWCRKLLPVVFTVRPEKEKFSFSGAVSNNIQREIKLITPLCL